MALEKNKSIDTARQSSTESMQEAFVPQDYSLIYEKHM
jgi:hypothetical protein